MRAGAAAKVVFAGWVPNSTTVAYTLVGASNARARITFVSFHNSSTVDAAALFRIVPSGGTTTDSQWNLFNVTLASKESFFLHEAPDSDGSLFLLNGDSIVIYAYQASAIAGRICVEELAV